MELGACAACGVVDGTPHERGCAAAPKRVVLSTESGGPWCCKCPFWDGQWHACQLAEGRDTYEDRDDDEGSPRWCPVRVADVTVTTDEREKSR